jgi:hypothetical protein
MAFTITPTIDDRVSIKTVMGEKLVVVKLACVSDGSSSGEYDFPTAIMREIRGSWLYLVKFVPGTVGAAFEFDVWDKNDDKVLDTAANSNSATSFVGGHNTLGVYPPVIHELSVEIDGADAMTDTNTLDIYMYFTK